MPKRIDATKRLSKRYRLTKRNLAKVPPDTHGVYVIRDKNGVVLYVGSA